MNLYPDIMKTIEEAAADGSTSAGLLHYFYLGDEWGIWPSLIFLGVGAMTDFGPLIANPKSFLLGAAAQFWRILCLHCRYFNGLYQRTGRLPSPLSAALMALHLFTWPVSWDRQTLMGPIAVAAYFLYVSGTYYFSRRSCAFLQQRKSARSRWSSSVRFPSWKKILFPVVVAIVVILILPSTAPLIGMLMLGNLFRESGVVKQLTETASNAMMYIIVILLGYFV